MRIRLKDGIIDIIEANPAQASAIKSWGLMRYNRKAGMFSGIESEDLLDRLAKIITLPEPLQRERQRLRDKQKAVDYIRTVTDPKPIAEFPVKKSLYQHQIRAADMALVTFDVIPPGDAVKKQQEDKK